MLKNLIAGNKVDIPESHHGLWISTFLFVFLSFFPPDSGQTDDTQSSILYHPSATSSIIIRANRPQNRWFRYSSALPPRSPGSAPPRPRTSSLQPQKPADKGESEQEDGIKAVSERQQPVLPPRERPIQKGTVLAYSFTVDRHGNDRSLREVLNPDPDCQSIRSRQRDPLFSIGARQT